MMEDDVPDLTAAEGNGVEIVPTRLLRAEIMLALVLVVAGTLAPLLVLSLADLDSADGLFVIVASAAFLAGSASLFYGLWLLLRSRESGPERSTGGSAEDLVERSRGWLWLAVGAFLVVWQVGVFGIGFLLFFANSR